MSAAKNKSRRGLLLGLAGLSAMAWGWQRFVHRAQPLRFAPIEGLPGWRRAETVAVSGGSGPDAVFLGIGEAANPSLSPDRLCETLYANPGPGLPIAVFTDINCPNCKSLEAKLAARADQLSVTWLQLPLLGPGSEAAARVAIAAELLSGKSSEPPLALRGRGIGPVIRHHASRVGLDPEILNEEMDKPQVTARLRLHLGAAETLGIWGTPAMTIGQTLVMGDVASETLDALIATDHPVCA